MSIGSSRQYSQDSLKVNLVRTYSSRCRIACAMSGPMTISSQTSMALMVEPVRAHVARQIEQFVGGEVGRRHAVQDLLVGGVGRLGRTPVLADQRLDGRPVDDVERIERAAARVARIDGRRV